MLEARERAIPRVRNGPFDAEFCSDYLKEAIALASSS